MTIGQLENFLLSAAYCGMKPVECLLGIDHYNEVMGEALIRFNKSGYHKIRGLKINGVPIVLASGSGDSVWVKFEERGEVA